MMIQVFLGWLLVSNCLTATCDRGNRLISEAGGVQAISGVAVPEDAESLAGIVGISDPNQVNPFQIIPTIPGAHGILDFSDFYALMPLDNPNAIAAIGAVQFPRTGSPNVVINRVNGLSSEFELPVAGTYLSSQSNNTVSINFKNGII